MTVAVQDLDFDNTEHVAALLAILSTYAQEEGGGQQQIAETTLAELPGRLREFPTRHVLLATKDSAPAGVLVAFLGMSTFKAKPVLNVHDLAVLPEYRGQGIGTSFLTAAAARARELECCKVTLEVISSNDGARKLYERCGFGNPTSSSETLFLERPL